MADAIDKIIEEYNTVVKYVDKDARGQEDRAYGGMVRMLKGKILETITEQLVRIAWERLGGGADRMTINAEKIRIPIRDEYINALKDENVKSHILSHKEDYWYGLSVDKHVFIDGNFVMGIECKAYTENAMIKRILVDFHMLKTLYPDISCRLFQLESQLGGDYSDLPDTVYGCTHTHSIMSGVKQSLHSVIASGSEAISYNSGLPRKSEIAWGRYPPSRVAQEGKIAMTVKRSVIATASVVS